MLSIDVSNKSSFFNFMILFMSSSTFFVSTQTNFCSLFFTFFLDLLQNKHTDGNIPLVVTGFVALFFDRVFVIDAILVWLTT